MWTIFSIIIIPLAIVHDYKAYSDNNIYSSYDNKKREREQDERYNLSSGSGSYVKQTDGQVPTGTSFELERLNIVTSIRGS